MNDDLFGRPSKDSNEVSSSTSLKDGFGFSEEVKLDFSALIISELGSDNILVDDSESKEVSMAEKVNSSRKS